MASNHPFHAALRAHTFHRLFPGGNVRPIRWQASEATPPGSLVRPPRSGNWTSTAVVVAIILGGVIAGAGTVVTLEMLGAPESAPGVAAASPIDPGASDDERSAAAMIPAVGKISTAVPVWASGTGVIFAEDGGNGLAPAAGEPLRSSAKVIPLPQRVATGVDLRPTAGDGEGGDTGEMAAIDSRGVSAAPPGDAAPSGVGVEGADPVDVTAAGGDSPAASPPPTPTPRPDHGGLPESGLAYAPAAGPVDRGAKAIASKGYDKPPATALKPAAALVVSSVNMRAGADNKAPIVTALRAGTRVTIVKCKFWCEIVADGKRGFVFKSFLMTTGATRI